MTASSWIIALAGLAFVQVQASDPWEGVYWEYELDTTDQLAFAFHGGPVLGVTIGFSKCFDAAGRVLVLDDGDQNVACGVIPTDEGDTTAVLEALSTYSGSISFSGSAKITYDAESGGVSIDLSSLTGTGVTRGATGGIHIHTGTDCNNDLGEHYYQDYTSAILEPDDSGDYWSGVTWSTNSEACFDPQLSDQRVPGLYFQTPADADADGVSGDGTTPQDVDGRAVVVHAADGQIPIGCGLINDDPWPTLDFTESKAFTGEFVLSGYSVRQDYDDDGAYLNLIDHAFILEDSDGNLRACGCCIDESSTTSLYDSADSHEMGTVTVNDNGDGTVSLTVDLAAADDFVADLYVDGAMSCNNSPRKGRLFYSDGAQIMNYPGYAGSATVRGHVTVASATDAVAIDFSTYLVNEKGIGADLSGGVSIYTGTSCDDAALSGHLYAVSGGEGEEEVDHTSNCSWYSDPAHNYTDADTPLKCKSYAWIIAVSVMLFAACISNAGFNMQKLSQRQKLAGNKAWLGVWWGGMGFIAIAGVADFVALEFGDVTLVTPLGSLTLIANIFMANWFHGEKLYVRDGVCTAIILVGNIITIVFAPHASDNFSTEELRALYSEGSFVAFVIILLVIILGVSAFTNYATNVQRRYGKESPQYMKLWRVHSMTYPFVGGIYGSQSVTFTKGVLIIITDSLSNPEKPFFLGVGEFWPLGILVVTCIVMQMFMMNIGLAKWDAMVVIPVFQSTWTMVSILSGAIVYNEFHYFNECAGGAICTAGGFGLSWIFFFVGLAISITGVFLISKRKSNEQPAKKIRAKVGGPKKLGEKKKGLKYQKVGGGKIADSDDDESSGDDSTTSSTTNDTAADEMSEKDKAEVSPFSDCKEFLLTTMPGQTHPLTGVTLSVRTVVVERKDTSQRWPFTVLMVTYGAPKRPAHISTSDADDSAFKDEEDEEASLEAKEGKEGAVKDLETGRVHLFDVLYKVDGESLWRPGMVNIESIRARLRIPGARITVRRMSKIQRDDFAPLSLTCAQEGGRSFLARLQIRVARILPFVLPVACMLQEESFDDVYVSNSSDAKASAVGVTNALGVVGGEGAEGPRIMDDFGVAAKIVWRHERLFGLCNYDGSVLPGPGAELSMVKLGVDAQRPTTYAKDLHIDHDDDDSVDDGLGLSKDVPSSDDGSFEIDLNGDDDGPH